MAPSPVTPTRGELFKTVNGIDRAFNPSRRIQFHKLPPVQESSIESIDGGASLTSSDNSDPFAALRSKSKSANNSPSTSSDYSASVKDASHLSEPTNLQTNIQRSKFDLGLEKLAASTKSRTRKLNPSTAIFTPAPALQLPGMYPEQPSMGNTQDRNNMVVELNPSQPQGGGSFNGVGPVNPPGPNTFAQHTHVVSSPPANGTPHGYTTFPAQVGGPQAQPLIPFPQNNGVSVVNGMTAQAVRPGANGTGEMTFSGPNVHGPQQHHVNTNGVAFGVPYGNSAQHHVHSMNDVFATRDGNAPQQAVNVGETTFNVPSGRITPHVSNMNELRGSNFAMGFGSGAQQPDNSAQGMAMMPTSAMNGIPSGAYGMPPVANGSNGSSFEKLSISALQAHLNPGNQYPQAQPNLNPAFSHGVTGPAQPSNLYAPFLPQNNVAMQQHSVGAPMRIGAGTPYGSSTPAPSASVYNSPGGTFTPAQYMSSPSYRGRTDSRNSDAYGNALTEPPPQFALGSPALAHQQVYSNVISPSSAGGQVSTHGTVASSGHSSSNSVVDPFNGPALPGVIQPIEPQTAMVLHENAVPVHIRNMRSKQLNELTAGPTGRPRPEVALDAANFPFIESARNAQPTTHHGVVKLKNIPFGTKRSEVLAFLGRNSKVLNDSQEPVHIIMERVTVKTNDAYVEFMSMQAAVNAVEKHQKTVASGRLSRIGDRPIEVELSSQAALMKDLFPLANGVRWEGSVPIILDDDEKEPWNCFKGFVTDEEMAMLVKHVEVPQRRPFECMISTLRKLPWYKTENITIKQRHSVYTSCIQLIRLLQHAVKERKDEDHLTEQLLKRLWTSAMLCHGFTVTMKDNIAYQVGLSEDRLRELNMPRFANMWVHAYTMCPKPGTPLDVLEYYIALVREETIRTVGLQQPNIQARLHKEGMQTSLYWGYFFKELNLPHGPAFDNMTLSQMAEYEFRAFTNVISRALA
ncbi:hypothetical protein Daus18300_008395 [Diaporthe australafricana]|uniref:RRM domain-containing protein n=1 Tax=Diaporthe australafricana TaxID=127596 RepID=A0ABR3WIE3_9PEZI